MGNDTLQVWGGEKGKQCTGIRLTLPSHHGSVHMNRAEEQPEFSLDPERVEGGKGHRSEGRCLITEAHKSNALFLSPLFTGWHRPNHSPSCCVFISTLDSLYPTYIPQPSQKEQTRFNNPTLLGLAFQKHFFFLILLCSG